VLEDRTVPSTVNWVGGSGNWTDGTHWDSGHMPMMGDDVVIDVAGVTVTHAATAGNSALNSLFIRNAALNLSGGSVMTPLIQGTSGTIALLGGTVAGPSPTQDVVTVGAGVTIQCTASGGTLSGLVANGTIDVTASGARVTIINGMTLNGTILVGDQSGVTTYGQVFFSHSPGDFPENIGGPGQIIFGGSTSNLLLIATANTTVEFESDLKIHGKSGQILTQFASSTYLNGGTINADVAGGSWLVDLGNGNPGANQGTIEATNGAYLSLEGNWTNIANSTANGILTVGASSTLNLGGVGTLPTETLTATGGTIRFGGTVTNQGTLTLAGTGGTFLLYGGTIVGGTIAGATLVGTTYGGTLDGVTLNTNLDLTAPVRVTGQYPYFYYYYGTVTVTHGLTLNGTATVGDAAGNNSDFLDFAGTQPQAVGGSGSIVFGGSTGNALRITGAGQTVTLGSGLTVRGKGGSLAAAAGVAGTAYVIQGTVAADVAGGTLTIGTGTWTNSGTVQAQNGGTLSATTPTNFSSGTLTGGSWNVFAGSTLRVTLSSSIVNNAASILLDGSNSNFYRDSGTTNALAGFATNTGTFTIQNGRNFTTAGDFENDGALTVGNNSTFTVSGVDTDTGTLTVLAGGTLSLAGGGSASGTVSDAGTLTVAAGTTFTVSGAYSQTGTLQVPNMATVTLSGNFSNFANGTLTGGTYQIAGIFQFANAAITTNAATIVLDGTGAYQITDLLGNDALASTFATNQGSFGILNGAAFTTAGDFENDGTLTVGAGSTFSVSGNFTQGSNATLDLQLAGTSAGQFGTMAVTGTATLAGTLLDTPVPLDYRPPSRATFQILTYGARSGDFATGPARLRSQLRRRQRLPDPGGAMRRQAGAFASCRSAFGLVGVAWRRRLSPNPAALRWPESASSACSVSPGGSSVAA
jgi:hypothetical protein